MTEQQALLQTVRQANFAMLEAGLYLATHPDCSRAMAYFRKQQAALKAACAEYSRKYGPLTLKDQEKDERWNWIDGPWPWEGKE